jgi:hypothetical protein
MRRRLLGLGAGLALVFAVLTRGAGGPPNAGRPGPARVPVAPQGKGSSTLEPEPLPAPPERDIFRYGEAPAAASRPLAPRPPPARLVPSVSLALPPPSLPLRLVGLVRRTEGLRAAVAISSGVVLVGPGDSVSGYTVLGVDEERGLRLRGPDGEEIMLEAKH